MEPELFTVAAGRGHPLLPGGSGRGNRNLQGGLRSSLLLSSLFAALADVYRRKHFQGSFVLCLAGQLDSWEALTRGRSQGISPHLHFSVCLLEGGLLCGPTLWFLVVWNRPGSASSVCWVALDPTVPLGLSSLPQSRYSNTMCSLADLWSVSFPCKILCLWL